MASTGRWFPVSLTFLVALLLVPLILAERVEAGCGSYVRVGNWQHGGRQLRASGVMDWRMHGTVGPASQGLQRTSMRLHLGGQDEAPSDCQGPNCSRQSAPLKVPAPTSVPRSHSPEILPLRWEVWAPQFCCCGWLTLDAASPLQRAASILRPPRVAGS